MFDLNFAKQSLPQIIVAAPMTLLIALVATLAGLILAILIVMARERKYPIPIVTPLVATLISFIRGTPILVQLYVVCLLWAASIARRYEELGMERQH